MLLTITNIKSPATDLGCLLHKNPRRVHSFELSFGKVHVFYPEASADREISDLTLFAIRRSNYGGHCADLNGKDSGSPRPQVSRRTERIGDRSAAMWTNRRSEHGPFDIIGDVHGCFDELRELMTTLGYADPSTSATPAARSRNYASGQSRAVPNVR